MLKLTKSKYVKYTMRILARITNLLLARVRGILKKKNLKLRRINARWIPHLLSDEQKKVRVKIAKDLLKLYQYTPKRVVII